MASLTRTFPIDTIAMSSDDGINHQELIEAASGHDNHYQEAQP